ncbi:hypothetical protein PM082_020406 [Marasmius tenuissimus]|nr:hypothetical protein PM082_020406 [Marasmius tenuissimus]
MDHEPTNACGISRAQTQGRYRIYGGYESGMKRTIIIAIKTSKVKVKTDKSLHLSTVCTYRVRFQSGMLIFRRRTSLYDALSKKNRTSIHS